MAEELCVLQLHAVVEVLEQDGGETSRSAAGHPLRPFKAPRAPHHVEPVLKSVLLGFSAMFGVRCGDLSFWCSRDCEVCVSLSPPPPGASTLSSEAHPVIYRWRGCCVYTDDAGWIRGGCVDFGCMTHF